MKLLLIHADHFEYEVKSRAIPEGEELDEERKKGDANECIVAFTTVEELDARDPREVSQRGAEELSQVAEKLGVKEVVIYPYAHLSQRLAPPSLAKEVLMMLEEELLRRGYSVLRAPFGWYKSFSIKCKGHPLSELSRTVLPQGRKEEEPEEVRGRFILLDLDGCERELELSKESLEKDEVLAKYPLLKEYLIYGEIGGEVGEFPPHVELMRRLELVDYEPASDSGHFRFYPKGTILKKSLEEFATKLAHEVGSVLIETPEMYKLEGDIAEQVARFVEKDYRFEIGGKRFVLRFAADFGLFKMMSSATLSYKNLPLRVYELSKSFRYEKSGELSGLRRLRSFTMPDIHTFCRDLREGMEEYKWLLLNYKRLADSMQIDYVLVFRVVERFYEENKQWFEEMIREVGMPALIELLPEMKHYWIVKHEFQFIDSVKGNAQLSTVQLDVEDSERYGIYYVDEDGKKKGCIIVHSSMGSIERWIYALLEQAAKDMKKGVQPMLPLWLSPIQVRFIPVSDKYLDIAVEMAKKMNEIGIRADVDDRQATVPAKVRDAETEWIPYVVVVGTREVESGKLSVRVRREGFREMNLEDLSSEISRKIGDLPRVPLFLPLLVSRRPRFSS